MTTHVHVLVYNAYVESIFFYLLNVNGQKEKSLCDNCRSYLTIKLKQINAVRNFISKSGKTRIY